MKFKTSKKVYILMLGMLVVWLFYFFKAYELFNEVKDFTTLGAAYIVRILEFTNYRSEQLSLLFIVFFILISLNNIFCLSLYRKITYNKRTSIGIMLGINIALIIILCVISNIFWVIYVLLALLSIIIVIASYFVANILFGKTITFNKGDILYRSDGYESREKAKTNLNKKMNEIDRKNVSRISSDIYKIEDEYYFEIYADEKIILDNKGEFIVNEEI